MLHGRINDTGSSTPVTDADDEIFDLYTALQRAPPAQGLGQVDARASTLSLSFDLRLPPSEDARRRKRAAKTTRIDLELAQDLRSLRDTAGDTASVVWRASYLLCQLVLAQHGSATALLDLREASVVELGSGTGLSACALAPLCGSYIATDQPAALPLLRANILSNASAFPQSFSSAATVVELDWTEPMTPTAHAPDLVLAIDCLFNPSLAVPLFDAIEATTAPVALVLSELRDQAVMHDFLSAWLASERWSISRLLPEALGDGELGQGRYVAWIGRRIASPSGGA